MEITTKGYAMEKILDGVNETLLMGPGPSSVHPSVYEAIARPTIGHMDPCFIGIMNRIKEQLQALIGTRNRLTIPVSGTGSAGMETCFVNLVEKGDRVLILQNGVFGQRMADVAGRLGAEVDVLEFPWGTPVVVDTVAAGLREKRYRIVAIVHAETSTGVCNPVARIGELLKGTDTLYLVDTVTSLGGIAVTMDEWGCDALYSGTQKCLSCPPGLSPVSFSRRAIEKLMARTTKVPNWYLDLTMIIKYWEGQSRVYHHTAPVNMLYALCQALGLILEEGPEKVFERHARTHRMLVERLESMGMRMLVEPESRLPMLNAVNIPEGIDDAGVRRRMLGEFNIEIGGGLGPLAGKIWRIGLMGHTARPENVERVAGSLKKAMAS
jgi:alanine-glyoxylate transaminase/serine-glyoxylate transaminase/serine-pyruvate transaminase